MQNMQPPGFSAMGAQPGFANQQPAPMGVGQQMGFQGMFGQSPMANPAPGGKGGGGVNQPQMGGKGGGGVNQPQMGGAFGSF